ncbi:MAG: hydrogenase expression/formation protein HypE [candidate division Zixibacteria bacterium]|nr:hydrogenase expression/formation protein HypE [candidate division Zixibacteria bacterium]
MTPDTEIHPSCPLPIADYPHVMMAHGGGGRLMQQLIEKVFISSFDNPLLATRHDSAVFEAGRSRLAFTTDSYVVKPLFFPGGDIGTLAVNGTVNDLAMSGAKPLYLSAGFIIEEGFPTESLWRIAQSMRHAAERAGVRIVTGDTKVVDRGKGDGIFVNTAGIGVIEHSLVIAPASVRPGDAILLSGDIGRHGIAVMAAREGIAFETTIESDCAPLGGLAQHLLVAGIEIHCLRDLTRGGLASALVEIAQTSRLAIRIDESELPVCEQVQGACELLGLDPLYVANEGRMVCFLPRAQASAALELMRSVSPGEGAVLIGEVKNTPPGRVTMTTRIGVDRVVDMQSGEQLPRIC